MKWGVGSLIPAVLGLSAVAASACGNGAGPGPAPIITRPPFTATPTETPTPEPTSTPEPTPTPTPVPVAASSGGGNGGGGGSGVSASRRAGPPPVSLSLPALGVNSAIEQIGLVNNQLDTPHNPYNTGWYYTYDAPGQGGNAVFAAHVDYFPNIKGPFNQLSRLAAGDEVDVATSDGIVYTYTVVGNTRYDASNIPMGALIWPAKPADEDWVTLITCGGRFVATQASGAGEYLDRDVVVATRRR